jgi:hypothetical protein
MSKYLLSFIALIIAGQILGQKVLTIKSVPADAEIYNVTSGKELLMGVGTAQLKLERDVTYLFRAKKDGYVPAEKAFVRKKDAESILVLTLEHRVVKINASPADCHIYANSADKGPGPVDVLVPKDQSVTIEVKKAGFQPQMKTYYNKEGQDEPESSHLFKLENRLVSVKTDPSDATIYVDDKKKGEGNADIIIPKDKCVDIRVEKAGYSPEFVSYCNKDNENAPPLSDLIRLKTRVVQINTLPEDAGIFIDGKELGKGNVSIKIPEGKCTEVLIKRISYVPEKRELCNKNDMQMPDVVYSLKLEQDEAYQESEESDKANHNYNVQVSGQFAEKDAWKILNSIIQRLFDVETIDATTGYLRTNWNGLTYNQKSAFPTVVRTRVIVTTAAISPLTYNVKIESEMSKTSEDLSKLTCILPPLNMDQCFEPWPRILRKYNELISEIQRRLQEK